MKYMGSKRRIANEILPVILAGRKEGQWYVEPFCGGCNVIDKVSGNRLASDNNVFLISMFKALQNGWIPPIQVTELEYNNIKNNPVEDHIKGYVGFNLSFAGKFWGGYRRDKIGKRNYSLEAFNNVMKQVPYTKDIVFNQLPYDQLEIPANSIIYCDLPYKDTTKYKSEIDYEHFYQWCKDKKNEGHTIFVSEYWMPPEFKCVWEKEITSSLTQNTGAKRAVEKLFTL